MNETIPPRLIAYYLPQFHPIPENDEWWGKGFTEWTNVAKAKPLFPGHYQPHVPADLGFYDLRVAETRQAQADMAREYGIEGFCYWHYWFGGKRLLEQPFNEVLQSGKPDFPFCLAWANVTWTGIWYGASNRILIEQTYPGREDHIAHFNTLLPAFLDSRYLTVNRKPIFLVLQPTDLAADVLALWRDLALANGLPGLHFVGIVKNEKEAALIRHNGFDACTISKTAGRGILRDPIKNFLARSLGEERAVAFYQRITGQPFYVYDYRDVKPFFKLDNHLGMEQYPCVMPNWDNSPRSGVNGHIWVNSTPDIFRQHLQKAIQQVQGLPSEHQIVIVKSWNEWAEGNTLEPDLKFGRAFLEAVHGEVMAHRKNVE